MVPIDNISIGYSRNDKRRTLEKGHSRSKMQRLAPNLDSKVRFEGLNKFAGKNPPKRVFCDLPMSVKPNEIRRLVS
jgi:hypothetical protein